MLKCTDPAPPDTDYTEQLDTMETSLNYSTVSSNHHKSLKEVNISRVSEVHCMHTTHYFCRNCKINLLWINLDSNFEPPIIFDFKTQLIVRYYMCIIIILSNVYTAFRFLKMYICSVLCYVPFGSRGYSIAKIGFISILIIF